MILNDQDTYALGTTLLNPSLNAISEPVAKRLSTALKIPVFASIQAVPKEMSLSLERELIRVCREALGCHSGDGSPITLERASEASTTVLDR